MSEKHQNLRIGDASKRGQHHEQSLARQRTQHLNHNGAKEAKTFAIKTAQLRGLTANNPSKTPDKPSREPDDKLQTQDCRERPNYSRKAQAPTTKLKAEITSEP